MFSWNHEHQPGNKCGMPGCRYTLWVTPADHAPRSGGRTQRITMFGIWVSTAHFNNYFNGCSFGDAVITQKNHQVKACDFLFPGRPECWRANEWKNTKPG